MVIYNPQSCIDMNTALGEYCFRLRNCEKTPRDQLLVECGNTWNEIKCEKDKCYYFPVRGKIMFQLFTDEFWDGSCENLPLFEQLMEVSVCDLEGNDLNISVSSSMVGYNGDCLYQIFEIDTDQIDSECFFVRIRILNENGSTENEYCSQALKKAEDCKSYVEVEGKYEGYDCAGYYYGDPVCYTGDKLKYSNKVILQGRFKEFGGSIEKNEVGNIITSTERTRTYRLSFEELIPPYVKHMLEDSLLGNPVCVNGEEYDVLTHSTTNSNSDNNMFWFQVTMQKTCEVTHNC